jgi:hypothetical protein
MSTISKELAALDAVIEGASALASEALQRKADLKQGKLASEAYGRVKRDEWLVRDIIATRLAGIKAREWISRRGRE